MKTLAEEAITSRSTNDWIWEGTSSIQIESKELKASLARLCAAWFAILLQYMI